MNVTTSEKRSTVNPSAQNSELTQNSPTATVYNLPEKPLVTLEPSKSWVALNLRDLWHYRDLLYILTMRDVKVRYKQTILGAAWAIIQPLLTMLIFTFFFGQLAGLPSDGVPYPIFAFAGLLPWTFFSNAVTNSGNSLIGNSSLITKVYFPRMVIPMASVGAGLVDFAIAFVLLAILMVYYGVGFSINLLMLPVLVVITALLAIGVGMWMSALNVKYRDIRYALPFLIQLGLFASGIITPIPQNWRWLLIFNPIAGLIEGFRAACFGKPFDWLALGSAAVVTVLVLIYAAFSFRRMERSFADLV
ncbi:MAG: ABC transporter permease [Pyrinomonadaceae bacterium]|nr:ABC transporter permease [Pyrinomonadaceae bacterium]